MRLSTAAPHRSRPRSNPGFMTGPAQTRNPPNSDRAFRDASLLFNLASNPLRLRVLVSLIAGVDTIQQLSIRLRIDRRVISQHLHALLQAKLVESTRRGRSRIYAPTRSGHLLINATENLTGTAMSRKADPPAAGRRRRTASNFRYEPEPTTWTAP